MARRKKPSKSKIEEWKAQEEAAGTDFTEAGRWAYVTCSQYGLEFEFLERRTGFSVMRHLKLGKPPEQVAAEHGLKNWKRVWPSNGQVELNAAAKDVRLVLDLLPEDHRGPLLTIGRRRRAEMGTDEFPEPAESPQTGATDGEEEE